VRQIGAYHGQWRAFFVPRIMRQVKMTAGEYDQIPVFQYVPEAEERIRAVYGDRSPDLSHRSSSLRSLEASSLACTGRSVEVAKSDRCPPAPIRTEKRRLRVDRLEDEIDCSSSQSAQPLCRSTREAVTEGILP
jgi:hypothetical protein